MPKDKLDQFDAHLGRVVAALTNDGEVFDLIRQHTGFAFLKEFIPSPDRLIMLEISEPYVRQVLGGRRDDYIGKTDFDVWDYHTASLFFNHDMRIIRGMPVETDENGRLNEPWSSERTGLNGVFNGRKYRVDSKGRIFLVGLD